jgi:phosphoglycerate dehydrogenase-like enzyme
MKIYVEVNLSEPLKAAIREAVEDDEVIFQDELPEESERKEKVLDADIIFGNVKPAQWLEECLRLRWIQFSSAGFDAYRSLKIRGVATNMKDYFSQPCAETIVAGILALYRGIDELTLLKDKKQWVGQAIRSNLYLLSKKHVIILGAGNIGLRIAKILEAFDCDIAFYSRSPNKAILNTPEELEEAIAGADIVIGALPGTSETRGLFTNRMIDALRPNAIFCNVGRGNLLEDESYLVSALMNKRIAGAVLDVTAMEPIPPEHPLWDCPETILSQHSSGGNLTEMEGIVAMFLTNLKNFENGKPLMNQVELGRGY